MIVLRKKRRKLRVRIRRRCRNCEFFMRHIEFCRLFGATSPLSGQTCASYKRRRACRVCGCSEHDPCDEGCWWIERDLCSACG